MLNSAKIMAFVGTTNAERAKVFYEGSLGLSLVGEGPSALVFDSQGIMLRISEVQSLSPAPYTVLGWEVSDIRASIEALALRGVAFERIEGFPQDELGIFTFPDGTRVAWFKDPDGNLLSLTQFG
jgi:catechol 2,3-dioxygenase-like lactoylglutathione lyase family enzyme